MKNKYFLLIVVSILLASFSIAAHVITTSGGATSYSFNEDVSNLYNISVNITDLGQNANVTQVNITLPSSFSFLTGSQNTTAQNYSFVSTSSVLSWTNSTYFLINGTGGSVLTYFWFNATATTPGVYNITVTTLNGTGAFSSNISVTINDTTAPSLDFVSPTPANGANLSSKNITVNITATDNVGIGTIIIRLFNSSNAQINSSSSTTSPFLFNFTNLSDGTYRINATVNDSSGNVNNSETRIIIQDTVVPSISLSRNSATSSTSVLNITATITDVTGANSCTTSRGTISGSGNSRQVYETGLNCGTSYTYNVSCTDFAGNSESSTNSFSTDSCATSSSSSESGTTTTTSTFWIGTFVDSDVEFSEKKFVSREVRAKERIQIKINSTLHHIGIITLTSIDAVINVSSTPQQAVLSVGQSKKFEITNDTYYDINVTLVSINSTKANVTVEYIYEKIPETITPVIAANASGNESLVQEIKEEIMDKIGLFKDKKVIVITLGVIALIGAVVVSFYLIRKSRLKKPKLRETEPMQNIKRVSYTNRV